MLSIVGTSIGNIQDTTLRAFETILDADVIYAEDTRTFGDYYKKLQSAFDKVPKKEQQFISYHTQNEFSQLPRLLDDATSDRHIVLLSESGMPVISDPGSLLVQHLIQRDIHFTVIPGPTAYATALVYDGKPQNSLFVGFLPKKKSQFIDLIEALQKTDIEPLSFVAYESPHRIQSTLQLLEELVPACTVTVCRELTKKFEEIVRGTPKDLQSHSFKGEITMVVHLS